MGGGGGATFHIEGKILMKKKKGFFFISLFGKSAKLLSRNGRGSDMERGKTATKQKTLPLSINWTNFAKLQKI